jgi:tRNA threonylcarbamoyladenosine biosynthesis protein TsaE
MKKTVVFNTDSYLETENVGKSLAECLTNGGFVAFYGDLGAGKTAFIRGMGQALCPDAEVCSPTYAVINEYKVKKKTVMCHVDAYRIEDDDDLDSTGFYDCCDYENVVMAVEWSEKIPFAIPVDAVRVTITKTGENERQIVIENCPEKIREVG